MTLQCADWRDGALALNDGGSSSIGDVRLSWQHQEDSREGLGETTQQVFRAPVYLFSDRQHLLFTAPLPAGSSQTALLQQGAALLAAD